MNKNVELMKNTIIIFTGKFCTQFISFVLVPIYTRYLITADYGYVDLLQTYISLIVPIVILRLDSSIFRFLIDERDREENKVKIITTSGIMLILQIMIFIIAFAMISYCFEFPYVLAIVINIICISVSSVLLQLTRGIGDNLGYSIASIICGVVTVLLNFIFIVILKRDASSILIASSCGNVFCNLFLLLKNKLYRYFKLRKADKKTYKDMLGYSIPMIPDGLSWWVVNVSDRTIISVILGSAFNGIYAISCKFSNILSSVFQVFNMTWQESASLHINEEDRDIFFSSILENTINIFTTICLLIMVCMPYIFAIFIGESYMNAYMYIPLLLLGNVINAVANVIGAVYIAKKETKNVAKSTMLAAIINILINLICIKSIGLWAAVISTIISYIIVVLYRWIDSRKYVMFSINMQKIVLLFVVYILSTILYYIDNTWLNVVNFVFIFLFSLLLNWKLMNRVIKKCLGGRK